MTKISKQASKQAKQSQPLFKRILCSILVFTFILTQSVFAVGINPSLPKLPSAPALLGLNFSPGIEKDISFNLNIPKNTILTKNQRLNLKTNINYFLTALTVDDSNLWVNLNPSEPNRLVGKDIAYTDLGKDLLLLDLKLKKDTAFALFPGFGQGATEYWTRVFNKAKEIRDSAHFSKEKKAQSPISIPTTFRVWIVPDKAEIYETETSCVITKSSLKVLLESEYLKQTNNNDELQAYCEQQLKELILPNLTKKVNTDPSYEPLRQIYNAIILAKWYKESVKSKAKSAKQESNQFSSLINANNLKGLISKDILYPEQVFKAYVDSIKDGEYHLSKTKFNDTLKANIKRSYVSGGANVTMPLSDIKTSGTPSAAARVTQPNLGANISLNVNEDLSEIIQHLIPQEYQGRNLEERQAMLSKMLRDGIAYERQGTVFIKIKGLLGATGERAHIGFGDAYGRTVVYIDEDDANNEIVEDHELEEIQLYQGAIDSGRLEGVTSLSGVRAWMRSHQTEAFKLAAEFHQKANQKYNVDNIAAQVQESSAQTLLGVSELQPGQTPSVSASVSEDINSASSEELYARAEQLLRSNNIVEAVKLMRELDRRKKAGQTEGLDIGNLIMLYQARVINPSLRRVIVKLDGGSTQEFFCAILQAKLFPNTSIEDQERYIVYGIPDLRKQSFASPEEAEAAVNSWRDDKERGAIKREEARYRASRQTQRPDAELTLSAEYLAIRNRWLMLKNKLRDGFLDLQEKMRLEEKLREVEVYLSNMGGQVEPSEISFDPDKAKEGEIYIRGNELLAFVKVEEPSGNIFFGNMSRPSAPRVIIFPAYIDSVLSRGGKHPFDNIKLARLKGQPAAPNIKMLPASTQALTLSSGSATVLKESTGLTKYGERLSSGGDVSLSVLQQDVEVATRDMTITPVSAQATGVGGIDLSQIQITIIG